MNNPIRTSLAIVALSLASGACEDRRSSSSSQDDVAVEKRSIFRPEFQVEPIEELRPSGSLETRILFPEGAELTEDARAELATVLASPQIAAGYTIVLRGHSDSGGNDEVNMRVSLARAEAVRDWLVENGVAPDRISVIAFGEQNPASPNALPDGSPDEDGRAVNRRVEIEVRSFDQAARDSRPTLAESLATTRQEEETEDNAQTQ
ncbi:OmpA family protein [Qipengyuania qiaonensis]|uniref:OmpA family protein n=1 Tax=Qipengyuania qiaonensis TaxID=2867240 RepID=A0ABS7J4U2_9SPHN|nr:OmpA family protein [Qipengyuania qiaonensis]MBX7482350.1 OmpA family protein [Qipengyuania qiaonensis]